MMRTTTRWSVAGVLLASAGMAHAAGDVVISQVYGGGGNSGAPYQNDFVELFNRSSAPVNLAGWSLQYASATGTGNFAANPVVALSGTLQPGQHYLIHLSGGASGVALPPADAQSTTAMGAGAGKVALVSSSSGLACNGGSTACSPAQLALIVDLVGYGGASFFETSPTPVLTNSTAAIRVNGGCTDTDVNNADFTTGTPTPRNTMSPLRPCGEPGNEPILPSCPAGLPLLVGVGGTADIGANDADGFVASAVITSAPLPGITLGNVVAGNPLTAQLQVSAAVPVGNYPVTIQFSNSDAVPQTASCTIGVGVAPPVNATRIHDIQGASHLSPLNGQNLGNVPGIVTAVRSNGFYIQDPLPDANVSTSEGIFVFTNSAPTVVVGQSVQVSGTVSEFRPGGSDGLSNLTTTEIVNPSVTVVSSGNPLPAAVLLGAGGRAIPTATIDNDATGSVETSGSFDAATDGIDFFESLEGMLVRVNNAVATGPTNSFGEISVLADNGVGSVVRSARGGIVIAANDFNPERMILDDGIVSTPSVNTGDGLSAFTAVVDYSFGNFKFNLTAPVSVINNGLTAEATSLVGSLRDLTVASYNVENLAATNPPAKFSALAGQIVNNLRSPDIVALMEVQDNNGATNNGVVDATTTLNGLVTAIQGAGGPAYQFRGIDPANNQDGGEPGGNIRVVFLLNPARVSFVDRPRGTATAAVSVLGTGDGAQLSFSPGRIDPTNAAFANSRKPLAGEFMFNGRRLFVIANHFNSKGGDDPLFGRFQPPVRSSEVQRHQQATIVNGFVRSLLTADPNASAIVLGDLNDFEFSQTLALVKEGGALVDLIGNLPENERYGYVFDGNSQVLDHILVSPALASFANPVLDIVHANAEFANQTSDHDPDIVRLTLPRAGDVDGDGDIDRTDVQAIGAARNAAPNGPFDPRNMNGDARIDALDARLATLACTRAGCVP